MATKSTGYIFLFCLLFSLSSFLSCKEVPAKKNINKRPGKNEMADLNRYFVQKDRERIQNYIERKNLEMTETETGLWYSIQEEGKGDFFTDGDKIIMDYDCYLLDGTKCYSSKNLGQKVVVLGRSEMEPGLNEGFRFLKPGAEAIFILPPFLAYGFVGDGNMIPSRSVLVYKITILPAN